MRTLFPSATLSMKIPSDAEIDRDKITRYLLIPRRLDDKSKFLARGGFTPANPDALEAAIRKLASLANATDDGRNEYGVFWRVYGTLEGPKNSLPVVLIWLQWAIDGWFHFVTLKPLRETR